MSSKIEAYKQFIDAVVSVKDAAPSEWVRRGSFPEIESNKQRNEVLATLTEAQRNEVALIVQEAKESGIHDLLSLLNESSALKYNGVELPQEPFGTELHFDFMARAEGDQWPE